MTRRTSKALFLLLLFTLQTFLPAFAASNSRLSTAQSDNADGLMSAHSYDALNRLATVSDNSVSPAYVQAYTYDNVGNLFTSTGGNGLTHRYSYSPLNRLTHLSIGALSDGTDAASDFSSLSASHTYTLNASGHRTAVLDSRSVGVSPTSTRSVAYAYDQLYRLTSETIGASSDAPSGTISYTHDRVGNRLSRTTADTFLAMVLPNQSQSYNANDQLDGNAFDANGNTTQSPAPVNSALALQSIGSPSVSDIYDFRNKLIRRTQSDGSTIDLEYNADALLVAKRGLTGATKVSYLQETNNHTGYAQIVEESVAGTSGPEVFALNVLGHDVLHTHQLRTDADTGITDWSTHHYLYDGLGSVRGLTNDTGLITDTYDYDAFGTLLHSTGDTPNSYLYTGERFDPDLGFYYLRARFHDTNLGRFHTLDTYEGRNGEPMTLHKYLYTHADPVNNWDPNGRNAIGLQQQAAVFGIIATLAVITHNASSGSNALGQDILGFGDLIGGLQDYFLAIGNTMIVTGGITETTTPDNTQSTTAHIDVVQNAIENARVEEFPKADELSRRRRRFNTIWFHYDKFSKPLLEPGAWVTNRALPYDEAINITFIEDVGGADIYQHTVVVDKPGEVILQPRPLRPGLSQGRLAVPKVPTSILPIPNNF